MNEQKKQQIDIRDVYTETVKSTKEKTVNWVKRYGYWGMIVILFILATMLSLITIGDVYRITNETQLEVYNKYIEAGHTLTENDEIIVRDLITEAFANDELLSESQYFKFVETVKEYKYEREDGSFARFDSIIFYLYGKEAQSFINFNSIPKWQLILVAMNGILGILVTITFMRTGIQDGLVTQPLKNAKNKLNDTSTKAAKKRLRSEEYFSKLHKNQLESIRRTEITLNGLIYEDYFDKDGRYIEGKYNDVIQKILNTVLAIKVAQLSFDALATNTSKNNSSSQLIGISNYTKKRATRSIILKTLMIVFFTFVSVSLVVTARTPLQAFMHMISTVLMFAAGVLEYLNSYSFIIDEYIETLHSKIRHLESFMSYCEEEELKEASKMRDDAKAQMIKELEDKQKEVTNV